MQASLASKAKQSTDVPWIAVTKMRAPDVCKSFLLIVIDALQHGKGRVQILYPAVSGPGKYSSKLLRVCVKVDACTQPDTSI